MSSNWCDWVATEWTDVIFLDLCTVNVRVVSSTVWITHKYGKEYDQDCLVPKFAKCTPVMV